MPHLNDVRQTPRLLPHESFTRGFPFTSFFFCSEGRTPSCTVFSVLQLQARDYSQTKYSQTKKESNTTADAGVCGQPYVRG
jgi:hypothetical protein